MSPLLASLPSSLFCVHYVVGRKLDKEHPRNLENATIHARMWDDMYVVLQDYPQRYVEVKELRVFS